jgi:hypothetical protein
VGPNCDDANPCTDDTCDPLAGCTYVPNNNPCDDANACTNGEACVAGTCGGGAPVVCNDGNACTDDACVAGTGCVYTPSADSVPCDDANACTTGDVCMGGMCTGGNLAVCGDGNPCTNDLCDPTSGCVYTNNSLPCDDGNFCTEGDICLNGSCTGGPVKTCPDGNLCANGTCDCIPMFTWSEFIATSADLNKLPSLFQTPDSRGGSVEYNFNGGVGFNGITNDAPYSSSILTLRNGQPRLLEQVQMNRIPSPKVLDANGCSTTTSFPQCWVFYPQDGTGTTLVGEVPTYSTGSNQFFDNSGLRVEISGSIELDYSDPVFSDNSHETMFVEWYAPLGINKAQLLLRGRYDWKLDFLNATDYFVPLFWRNISALGPNFTHPAVTILEETPTRVRIAVNAQIATERVCEDYFKSGLINRVGGPK